MNHSPWLMVVVNVSAVSSEAAALTGSAEAVIKREEYKREKESNMVAWVHVAPGCAPAT